MIQAHSYTKEWIDAKVKEYDANSYDLAEKMVYAFTLLEHLRLNELDFIFKGGTSLVLMLGHFHRFSKDIDILISKKPENLHQIFDAVIANTPFVRWELSERKNDEMQVPKEHYKFIYQQSKPAKYPEQPVLLDIIFVENTYPHTQFLPITHSILNATEPYTKVITPTIDSITGDKLTAFAPSTIGVPMGKNKAVEIAKQLFDLGLLSEKISNIETVKQSFEQTANMVIKHYKSSCTIEHVYDDIIDASFTMCMMGKVKADLYHEIKAGVTALNMYLSKQNNFGYNKAILSAAKVSYMAACLKSSSSPNTINMKEINSEDFNKLKIEHPLFSHLNKTLKGGYPEAWLFWYYTSKLI